MRLLKQIQELGCPHVKAGGRKVTSQLKILHVVESFGGGVASALSQYALATLDYEHHLLCAERSEAYADDGEAGVFASYRILPRSPVAAMSAVRNAAQELQPDIVHAHSSFGGLYVRLALRATARRPIIYTPHGYAFERKDVSPVIAHAFRAIEWLLHFNTSAYAACSPREAQLSLFSRTSNVHFIPNVAEVPLTSVIAEEQRRQVPIVAIAGRLTPARDPDFVAAVSEMLAAKGLELKFVWVGDGEPRYRQVLESAGVSVTGWLPRTDALKVLARATLHLHPATWDGFPMVLLEANRLRVPSVLRDIPPFESLPGVVKVKSVADAAEKIARLTRDEGGRRSLLNLWDDYLANHTTDVQRARLANLYESEFSGRMRRVLSGQARR